ncbi:Bridging integrator 3-like protein, partial [Dinothrombium tinctorium]
NPLKKLSAAKPTAAGIWNAVDEEDIEKLSNRLSNIDLMARKIHKTGKRLNDNLLLFNRFEAKLSNDLSDSHLCQQYSAELRTLIEEWHSFNAQCSRLGEDYAFCVQKVVVDPLKRFEAAVNEIRNVLKKREHLRNECVKLNAKLNKLIEKEKTGQNLVKLEHTRNSLSKAEEELKQQNELILREVPDFIDYRINYFQPTLEALIKAQTYFWGESAENYNQHFSLSSEQLGPLSKGSLKEYKQNQMKLLNQISSLSIVEGSD